MEKERERNSMKFLSLCRAEDGTQTRDPQLGRLMLYQLSYFRIKKGRNIHLKISPFILSRSFQVSVLPVKCGQRWIRTTEVERQQIYSLPHLTALETSQYFCFTSSLLLLVFPIFEPLVGFEPTTPRLQITCSGQLS